MRKLIKFNTTKLSFLHTPGHSEVSVLVNGAGDQTRHVLTLLTERNSVDREKREVK